MGSSLPMTESLIPWVGMKFVVLGVLSRFGEDLLTQDHTRLAAPCYRVRDV